MQPIATTEADQMQADAEIGGELVRLRREKVVLVRRVDELEAKITELLLARPGQPMGGEAG
jgi:hypothetical protein